MVSLILLCLVVILSCICAEVKIKFPSGMTQHQYCSGCVATVAELENALSKRHLTPGNREEKIIEMMEKICAPANFVKYDYSPPKMEKACKLLMENHEEELESALVKGKPNVEQLICYDVSKACEGVDLSTKDKKAKFADIDFTDGDGSRTVKVDPVTQKFTVEDDVDNLAKETKMKENNGKTLSKKDKQKKEKKKTHDNKKQQQKGQINHINVDINDPQSMEKVMAQIKEMTQQQTNQQAEKKENKEEL